MTAAGRPPAGRRATVVRVLMVAGGIGLAAWLALRLYTSPAARTCGRLYAGARSAADSARVDSLVPDTTDPDGFTCGFISRSARWNRER